VIRSILILFLFTLAGCGVNSQVANSKGVDLRGGPSALNTAIVQKDEHRVTSNTPVSVVDARGGGLSMTGTSPMSTVSFDLGGGQMLYIGSSGNGQIKSVETENLVTGYKSAAKGIQWGSAEEILAHAQTAQIIYETIKNLSADEKAARIAQIEQAGQVAQAVIPLLKAMAGVP
jgi:hypothetical protein